MSCDNVQQNGEFTNKCILQFAKGLNNSELLEFIETIVTFENAMGKIVDRITAATTDADREYVRSHFGDSFCNGRSPLDLLSSSPYNVLLTEYIEAYECMKMHLLNASHENQQSVERVVELLYKTGSKETFKQWINEAPNQ